MSNLIIYTVSKCFFMELWLTFLCSTKDRKQGCIAMTTGTFAGLWDVISCSNKEKYICKKQAEGVLVTTIPPTTPELTCASGWTPVPKRNVCSKVRWRYLLNVWKLLFLNNILVEICDVLFHIEKVYKKVKNERKSWQEAQEFCKAIGGDLMSIHSKKDLENLKYVYLKNIRAYYICQFNDPL